RVMRREQILSELKVIIHGLTGVDLAKIDLQATFFDMGVDSLLLIQAGKSIKERLGVEVSLVQLFEELSSIGALVDYLGENLSNSATASTIDAESTSERLMPESTSSKVELISDIKPFTNGASGRVDDDENVLKRSRMGESAPIVVNEIKGIIAQQLQIMSAQLEVLHRARRENGGHSRSDQTPDPCLIK